MLRKPVPKAILLTPKAILLIGTVIAVLFGFSQASLQAQNSPPLAALLKSCTEKATSGDTSAAVLNLAEALGKAPLPDIKEILPVLMQAVDDKNPTVRSLALSGLVALESRSNPDRTLRGDALPLLEPEIPRIAAHLTDEDKHIRGAAATVLGGFVSKPPDIVFPPLIAYLKREDAVTSIGSSVVFELVRLGAQRSDVAPAIIAFIDRTDQTPECLTSSIDAIAHAPTQSEVINTDAIRYLDAPNPTVRVAVIRDLPELQLSSETFTSTQAHLRQIAANDKEDPAVRAAANEILPCWTNDRKPCPAFSLPAPQPLTSDKTRSSLQQRPNPSLPPN